MPGILPGILQGAELGLKIRQTRTDAEQGQQRLDLEKQRVDSEQKTRDYALTHQQALDDLTAAKEEAFNVTQSVAHDFALVNGAEPLKAELDKAAPGTPEFQKASEAYNSYIAAPTFKSANASVALANKKLEDVDSRSQDALKRLSSKFAQEARDAKTRVQFNLSQGNNQAVTGSDLAGAVMAQFKLPPMHFAGGPNGEPSPAKTAFTNLANAWQAQNFDAVSGDDVADLFPELQASVGKRMPDGRSIVKETVGAAHVDPADHTRFVVQPMVTLRNPDGSFTQMLAPEGTVSIPLTEAHQRLERLGAAVHVFDDPQNQQKLNEAILNEDTPYHRFVRLAGSVGVNTDALLPKREIKDVPAGGSLVSFDPQNPGAGATVIAKGQPRASTVTAKEDLAQQLMADDPSLSAEEAMQRASLAWHPLQNKGKLVDEDGSAATGAGDGTIAGLTKVQSAEAMSVAKANHKAAMKVWEEKDDGSDPPDFADYLDRARARVTGKAAPKTAADAAPPIVPQDKAALKTNGSYTLKDGRVGVWNGTAFVVKGSPKAAATSAPPKRSVPAASAPAPTSGVAFPPTAGAVTVAPAIPVKPAVAPAGIFTGVSNEAGRKKKEAEDRRKAIEKAVKAAESGGKKKRAGLFVGIDRG